MDQPNRMKMKHLPVCTGQRQNENVILVISPVSVCLILCTSREVQLHWFHLHLQLIVEEDNFFGSKSSEITGKKLYALEKITDRH